MPDERTDLPSAGIDTTTPSVARAYDAALGGKDNYEVDRQLLAQLNAAVPEVNEIAVSNRKFLIRAVEFLARKAGIDQFLDCGSGLPTAENTHQVAQRENRDSRVVYVDNDPVVLAHGRALLEDNDKTYLVGADIFDPPAVLQNDTVRRHLDFERPLGLLQVATMHHHDADKGLAPAEVMRQYIEALPSGSYVVFSHFFDPEDEAHSPIAHRVQAILNASISRGYFRTRAQIEEMLVGLELLDPGLVVNDDWYPTGPRTTPRPAAGNCIVAAVGRKP
ncbi:SAM-dependent methyltransferase [Amycolatopsis sp. 195334CR]|uniref:SAM-dependent methyltransferase n=1 Tax=Amycolatopsis sp. 195334CR TaxID=2814588 RepID=UPI001A8C877C|nr:SAM-dependent methyltransferase [Amycolatopsis sp. 195334CR]MBN6042243.1 SAM-dependent methyltransferase [Amycolatopsis sp. 195334CR]